jgi:fructose-1,6-bisphosphatase I
MKTIFDSIKTIAVSVDALIKEGDLGYSASHNATGDTQLKMDVASDRVIEEFLSALAHVRAIISEEKDEVLILDEKAPYTICYDPLDGSSIVDANFSVGSIFGIYKGEPTGDSLMASIYVMYGRHIEMVSVERGDSKPTRQRFVHGTWHPIKEPFVLKEKGRHNAPGGTQQHWPSYHKAFIDDLFSQGYRLRYSGGMVPDLHHILVKGGGIFSYPSTTDVPDGKLRILFEVLPFALIFEAAGGQAIDHHGKRLLELSPRHHHDTTPCFFGSNHEIETLKNAYGME